MSDYTETFIKYNKYVNDFYHFNNSSAKQLPFWTYLFWAVTYPTMH